MARSNAHLLVVDDEAGIRNLFKEILEREGFTCSAAHYGEAALEVLAAEEVDLAIVDIRLPGMTGINLFQQIQEKHTGVGVVFVTAMGEVDVALEQVKSGALDYLVKPVTRQRFVDAVDAALEKRETELERAEEKRRLEALLEQRTEALENRAREVQALNRLIQDMPPESPPSLRL